GDADASGAVDVLTAALVVEHRARATLEDERGLEQRRAVRRLQREHVRARNRRHGARSAVAHGRTTVPAPASAWLTGPATRASPITTRPTPPASASPAPSSFLFMRPSARGIARSRSAARSSAIRLPS